MENEEFSKNHLNIEQKSTNLNYVELQATQTSEYYRQAFEFIENCEDNIRISSKGLIGTATKDEFLRSEELIQEIIKEIDSQWTTKQKAAYVHYKMGELVSYMPDCAFNNKIGNQKAKDARNIWKSIDTGMGLCNGIAATERNILSRIGVNTRELSSGTHTYVMVETEEGNILSDPTWDLNNTLFEGRPMHFGKTYEQLRQADGPLSKAHKLEQRPEDIIEISDDELREIYHSIGFTKDDRKFKFPILDRVNEINSQQFDNNNEKVSAFLQMFTREFSSQATHLSETRTMIERCIPALGIDTKSLTTRFVYSKDDLNSEKPYLCIHVADEMMNDSMAVLNVEQMQFEHLSLQDFDKLYQQHNEDTRVSFWKKYLQREDKVDELNRENDIREE